MPFRDGTGPAANRPGKGLAAGYRAGDMNAAGGRGRHGGRGRCNRFRATGLAGLPQAAMGQAPSATPEPVDLTAAEEQELDALKGQVEHLQGTLEGINKRIEELESQASEKAEQ